MTSLSNNREANGILSTGLSWPLAIPILLAVWATVVAIYFETSVSLVRMWQSSDLYSHGFLVIPVAGYMLWRRRHQLQALPVRPFVWGVVGIGFAVVVWWIGEATATNALRHLGLIGMLQACYVTIFGLRIARHSAYPLLFLFMALPFGSGLIEPLQVMTANGTVALLQATGIPVHLDGYLLVIPAGQFHIAEACAGLRFLLSTFALAWLAADILYTSPWRRLAFFGLAILVPLVANALRAYMILLIATLRGPASAATFDHVTYGLVFLGFVMLLLLLTGWLFRDRSSVAAPRFRTALPALEGARGSVLGIGGVAILSLAIVALPTVMIGGGDGVRTPIIVTTLSAPKASAPWKAMADGTAEWRPSVSGTDAEILQGYTTGAARVVLYIGYFAEERQGAEAVNELTDWAGPNGWRTLAMTEAVLPVEDPPLGTPCLRLARGTERRLVCYWYWVDGEMTASPYLAKLLRARAQLFGGQRSAAVIAVSVSKVERPEVAVETLRSLLAAAEPLDPFLDAMAQRP